MRAQGVTDHSHEGCALTHLQCRRDSYRSSSVNTVFPFSLCVSSSLQQPTTNTVLGHLQSVHKHFQANKMPRDLTITTR